MLKKQALGAGIALAVLCSAPVRADLITFDPTGTAGAAGNLTNINTFDWAPGNALSIGSVPTALNDPFTTLFQANLGTVQDNNSTPVFLNGTSGNFFTIVAGFGETVNSVTVVSPTQQSATFAFDSTNPVNFFRIYRNGSAGSNLNGTSFTGGTEILSGVIIGTNFTSNFNTTGGTQALDQFGGLNNYPLITSVIGSGSTSLTARVQSFNSNYFPDLVAGSTLSLFNTSQKLAFNEVDPSACFTNSTGTASCATNPAIGLVNGVSGPDFQFQADANSSFQIARVPEPGTLALIGLGMGLLGIARRRKA